MASPTRTNSSPIGNREGTRVILREITSTLQNSPPPKTPTKNKTAIDASKTPEHEIKVKFAREFVEVVEPQPPISNPQSTDSCSLSSASSFQSLTSTLSTKSSSGICVDSPSRSTDTSYANLDIPGLDDLLAACAGIRLEDSYADASFESATDESNLDITHNLNATELIESQENNKLNTTNLIHTNLNETKELSTTKILNEIDDIISDVDIVVTSEHTDQAISPEYTTATESFIQATSDNQLKSTVEDKTESISDLPPKFLSNSIDVNPAVTDSLSNICLKEDSEFKKPLPPADFIPSTEKPFTISDNNEINNFTRSFTAGYVAEPETCISQLSAPSFIEEQTNLENFNSTFVKPLEVLQVIESNTVTSQLSAPSFIEEQTNLENVNSTFVKPVEVSEVAESNTFAPQLSIPSFIEEQTNLKNDNLNFVKPVEVSKDIAEESKTTVDIIGKNQISITVSTPSRFENISKQSSSELESVNKNILNSPEFVDEPNKNQVDVQQLEEDSEALDKTLTLSGNESGESEKQNEPEFCVETNYLPTTIEDYNDFVPQRQSTSLNLREEIVPSTNENIDCTEKKKFLSAVIENSREDESLKQDISLEKEVKVSSIHESIDSICTTNFEDSEKTPLVDSDKQTFFNAQDTLIIGNNCDFENLQLEAQSVANDILITSLELPEDNEDGFVTASAELFNDPMSVDLSNFETVNSNKSNVNRLRTESLYVKFDPLVSNTSMLPQGNVASPPTNDDRNGDKEDACLPNHGTPKRSSAIAAIDRLLFYSPLPAGANQKNQEPEKIPVEKTPEPPIIIDSTMAKELEVVRTTVLQLEEQLGRDKKEHEKQQKELQSQNDSLRETISQLQKQLAEEIKSKNQTNLVVDEYEKSISRLVGERERDRKNLDVEKASLIEELQDAKTHLAASEAAFNDVHAKYERLKIVVTTSRSNEMALKESIAENVEIIKSLEHRYEQIKTHAAARLEKANEDLDNIRKQHESETVRLRAMLRKEELKSNSLSEMVEQKTKENKELTQILDEVIARVGHKSDD